MASVTRRVFEGVVFSSFEKLLVRSLSLLTFFLIVNNVSLKDFGLLQLLLALGSPAAALIMLGMERLIVSDVSVYRAKGEFGKIRRLFLEYITVIVAMFLFVCVTAWFLKFLVVDFYDVNLNYYYISIVLLVLGQVSLNFSTTLFEAYERFRYAFVAKSAEAIIRALIVGSFFFFVPFSLQAVFWAYILGKIGATLLSFPLVIFLLKKGDHVETKHSILRQIVRSHGKWEMVTKVVKVGADNMVPWIVNFFVSAEGVALFAFVTKFNSFITSVFPVRGVLFPILSHSIGKSRKLAIAIASKAKKYLLVVNIGFYILVFIFVDEVVAFTAPQYIHASDLILIALLHLFIDILTLGQTAVFYALKQQKINLAITTFNVALSLVTQVLFTYLWGVEGLFISWLFIGVVIGSLREYILKSRFNFSLLHIRSMFTFDEYDRYVLNEIKTRLMRPLRRVTRSF